MSLTDGKLRERVYEVWLEASTLVHGTVEARAEPFDLATADAMLVEAYESLQYASGEERRVLQTEVARLLADLHRLDRRLQSARWTQRLHAFADMRESLAELRRLGSERELLSAAPAHLTRCGFTAALTVAVDGATLRPVAVHGADDGVDLGGREWPLRELRHERELVRQRAAVLVGRAQWRATPALAFAEALGWDGFVAAPVVADGAAIAIVYGHRPATALALDAFDRILVSAFAQGLADARERRVLVDRQAALRREMQRMTGALKVLTDEAAEADLELGGDPAADVLSETALTLAGSDVLQRLTARERDVLELLATGMTNRAIAEHLVVTPGTVKTHVKRILRKLRAGNRAEAVARYLEAKRA